MAILSGSIYIYIVYVVVTTKELSENKVLNIVNVELYQLKLHLLPHVNININIIIIILILLLCSYIVYVYICTALHLNFYAMKHSNYAMTTNDI